MFLKLVEKNLQRTSFSDTKLLKGKIIYKNKKNTKILIDFGLKHNFFLKHKDYDWVFQEFIDSLKINKSVYFFVHQDEFCYTLKNFANIYEFQYNSYIKNKSIYTWKILSNVDYISHKLFARKSNYPYDCRYEDTFNSSIYKFEITKVLHLFQFIQKEVNRKKTNKRYMLAPDTLTAFIHLYKFLIRNAYFYLNLLVDQKVITDYHKNFYETLKQSLFMFFLLNRLLTFLKYFFNLNSKNKQNLQMFLHLFKYTLILRYKLLILNKCKNTKPRKKFANIY